MNSPNTFTAKTTVRNVAVVAVDLVPGGLINLAIKTLFPIPNIPSCMSIDLPPEDIDAVVDALLTRKAEALAIQARDTAREAL